MSIKKKKIKKPKESKQLKYLYFIVVLHNGEQILKFGISNNYRRRFKEYNNSTTIGCYLETLDVYKSPYPKRLETLLKWYMTNVDKPLFKYEYFDLRYYGMLHSKMLEFSDSFGIHIEKII